MIDWTEIQDVVRDLPTARGREILEKIIAVARAANEYIDFDISQNATWDSKWFKHYKKLADSVEALET